ncbi:22965_t:CDS:2 [Cetraspora pellucida]|uniref:22965_t:CDS:1 n=1 Tax=Cetraspora pellucida TaxID=1433469 RepID=A0A9N9DSW6_9GLOM|nr:22965_t:CDS:2 [Cetraspora pellucida]
MRGGIAKALYQRDFEEIKSFFNYSKDLVRSEEALRTILPNASEDDIKKYDEQLNKVDYLDPVIIISPNQNWIRQIIKCVTELYTVRRNIRRLYPNAFFNPDAQPRQEPIGKAWLLT